MTPLEPWEVSCHSCGTNTLSEVPPTVSDVAPPKEELEEAYRSWLDKGKSAFKDGLYEEATNCLREAIKRSGPLDNALEKEIDARKTLAETLEQLNKLQEAADQYRIIAQESSTEKLKEVWLKKSQDLVASSSLLPYDLLFQKEEFRALHVEELKFVPLYCVGCKRLLAEAEVYAFRRGISATVRCWCGVEGRPLAKSDAKHSRALQEAKTGGGSGGTQRAKAVAVATMELPGGKRKSTAALLAIFTGFIGGHKFYLGETTAGWIYAFWFWTLIPFLISLYEAIVLIEMSQTTFNMTYNIELVLGLVEPPEERSSPKMDVFSMEISEDTSEKTVTMPARFGKKTSGETIKKET
jgi:TM2 domain-containing membrane protein YozV